MIGQYTLYNWVLYFYIYCFLGWIFESCYVSFHQKKWVNRGFLHGPFLPIYGSGAVVMLFVSEPFKENLILTYFAGLVGATVLELFTGILMESLFKVRYWDYSYKKFQWKGYICLSSSLTWGFFTVLMNEVIHPLLLAGMSSVPHALESSCMVVISCGLAVDLCFSVREAFDLRNILADIEMMQKEVLILRKRADVVIAVLDQEWKNYLKKHPAAERMDEIGKEMELRFEKLRKLLSVANKLPEHQRVEFLEIKEHFTKLKEKSIALKEEGRGKAGRLLRGNPTMVSPKYADAFHSLKKFFIMKGKRKAGEKK